MNHSTRDPLPDLFGANGPPSSAGLAAGSEVQGPGGGSPAVGVNLTANASPYHTTQGSGSQAETSAENPLADNFNHQQPESMTAGNMGVNNTAPDNSNVAGSDGYAANDAAANDLRVVIEFERMITRLSEHIEGGSLMLLNLIMTTIQGGQYNADMHHFFIREDYDDSISMFADRLQDVGMEDREAETLSSALRLARRLCTPPAYTSYSPTGHAADRGNVPGSSAPHRASPAMMNTPRPPWSHLALIVPTVSDCAAICMHRVRWFKLLFRRFLDILVSPTSVGGRRSTWDAIAPSAVQCAKDVICRAHS
jgi:hypothetical protein